jgi:general secretion pathway protein K
MKPRRGVALLAALWLVVAIAAVALQFSLEARERRTIGILASERGAQRGLALGALALVRSQIDYSFRSLPTTVGAGRAGAINNLRSIDPLLDVAQRYNQPLLVDSIPVDVSAVDLGSRLNINQANETDLQAFFSFLLKDYSLSTHLAQAIMDWRDPDTLPRPSGGEIAAYLKAEALAVPTNGSFRDVDDLRNVLGMTPEIFAEVSPYLTVRGDGSINLNSAPVAVLRSLPGMTDQAANMIVMMRSQGRRINSVGDVFLAMAGRGGRGGGGGPQNPLGARASTQTNQVELTFTARSGPQSSPTKLIVILRRGEGGVSVGSLIW